MVARDTDIYHCHYITASNTDRGGSRPHSTSGLSWSTIMIRLPFSCCITLTGCSLCIVSQQLAEHACKRVRTSIDLLRVPSLKSRHGSSLSFLCSTRRWCYIWWSRLILSIHSWTDSMRHLTLFLIISASLPCHCRSCSWIWLTRNLSCIESKRIFGGICLLSLVAQATFWAIGTTWAIL